MKFTVISRVKISVSGVEIVRCTKDKYLITLEKEKRVLLQYNRKISTKIFVFLYCRKFTYILRVVSINIKVLTYDLY